MKFNAKTLDPHADFQRIVRAIIASAFDFPSRVDGVRRAFAPARRYGREGPGSPAPELRAPRPRRPEAVR